MDDEKSPEDAVPSPLILKVNIPGVGVLEIQFPQGLRREEYDLVVRRLEFLKPRHEIATSDGESGGE